MRRENGTPRNLVSGTKETTAPAQYTPPFRETARYVKTADRYFSRYVLRAGESDCSR